MNDQFISVKSSGSLQRFEENGSLKELDGYSHSFYKNEYSEFTKMDEKQKHNERKHNNNNACKKGDLSSECHMSDLKDQKVKRNAKKPSNHFLNLISLSDNGKKLVHETNDQMITNLEESSNEIKTFDTTESKNRDKPNSDLYKNGNRDVGRNLNLDLNDNRDVDRTEQVSVGTSRETSIVRNGRENGMVDQSEDGGQLMIIILIYEDFFIILVVP